MAEMTTRRTPLTRERVLDAAITLIDERGIDALSMRKLGQELGVEAMSLYNHVAGKDDLLDGIRDVVVAKITLPALDTEWKPALRSMAVSAHQVLQPHAWAGALWNRPGMPGAARMRYMEAMLRCLRTAGFPIEPAYAAYHVIDNYIVGVTVQQASFTFTADELPDLAAELLSQAPEADYPFLVEHVRQHLDGSTHPSSFEFGLDLLLDGLERMHPRPVSGLAAAPPAALGRSRTRGRGSPPATGRARRA